jgi:hypothetical protein
MLMLRVPHYKALKAGHDNLSPGYFDYVEKRLGMNKRPQGSSSAPYDERPVVSGGMMPVSRSSVNWSTGRDVDPPMRLSAAQQEICSMNGIDPNEYAQNYKRMQEMKKAGVIQT